jgi:hypothetical protein
LLFVFAGVPSVDSLSFAFAEAEQVAYVFLEVYAKFQPVAFALC